MSDLVSSSSFVRVRRLALTAALLLALLGVLAAVLVAPTTFAAGSTVPAAESRTAESRTAASGSTNAYSRAAFTATNTARRSRDLRTLSGDACLKRAALRQARAMAARGELFHQDLGRIQRDCGVGWVGENVAHGYPTGAALVREGWMRSEGHRANILSRNYRLMGLAAVKRDGRWWAAQVFGAR